MVGKGEGGEGEERKREDEVEGVRGKMNWVGRKFSRK